MVIMFFRSLFVFIQLCIILKVQAKAVSKEPKRVTFQDYHQSPPIQVIPQRLQVSSQGFPTISKSIGGYLPLMDNKPIIPHNDKYDLSNHESFDRMFNSDYPDSSKSQVKSKKPSVSRHRTVKEPASRKHKFEVFYDDQVFIEKTESRKKPNKVQTFDPKKSRVRDKQQDSNDKSCSESVTEKTLPVEHEVGKKGSTINNSAIANHENGKGRTFEQISKRSEFSSDTIEDETSMKIPIEITDDDSIEDLLNTDELNNEMIEVKSNTVNESIKKTKGNLKESSLVQPESHIKVAEKNPKLSVNRTSIASEDEQLMHYEVSDMFDVNFKSFVFNPQALPKEKFQECTTRKNESGHCRYVQHCMLPSILSSIQQFMENVCIIQERFVGVCCPEFPVSTLKVNWPSSFSNSTDEDGPVKTPQDCGVGANTRIVGGSDANRKAWPWMVALLNNKNKFYCGGALINDRYVLTASHCTFGTPRSQIIARLGEYDFKDSREPHNDYLVTEIKRHGQYTRLNLRNDIALLKLEKPVVFNELVKTVCLPKVDKDYLGKEATLVGWGHLSALSSTSDVLQEASFPIINNTECEKTHGLAVPPSLICAAAPSKDKGACNGDSGGPLMLLDEDNRWKVIGVVSWGRRGCSPKFPTVYTRVTHFLDWIEKHAI